MTERLDDEIIRLYRRSRELYLVGRVEDAEVIYRRIRAEHGCELYPGVELPVNLRLIHPIGCVLGRATYRGALVCYQCSGVGSDVDGNRPLLGDGVVLFPGARIIGNVTVGNNVWVTAGTTVEGSAKRHICIPDNVVVMPSVGDVSEWYQTPVRVMWKPTERSVVERFFNSDRQGE